LTYEKIAREKHNIIDLVKVNKNYLGPIIIILKIFNSNRKLVYLFNCFIFILSWFILFKNLRINKFKFLIFMFISPIMFSSLLSVNKEIISMLVIVLLVEYYKNKKIVILF